MILNEVFFERTGWKNRVCLGWQEDLTETKTRWMLATLDFMAFLNRPFKTTFKKYVTATFRNSSENQLKFNGLEKRLSHDGS